ncbi:MAG: L,D-transpeptidase [Verrucomicrobiota bacterium]
MTPRAFLILPVLIAALLASCKSTSTNTSAYSTTYNPRVIPPSNPAAVKVKISTGAQRVYVVENGRVLLASPCSVGKPGAETPHGTFPVLSKTMERRRFSQPGAGYPMTYWMSFYSPAYGMHWGFVKPYPCTMGCVRLPIKTAKSMFSMVRVGTPIHIASSHPEDATIGRQMPLLDDSAMPDPPMSYMLSPQVFADARQGRLYNF